MYNRILLPTDGSPEVGPAIEHAIELASRYDATLHALSVVDVASFDVADVDTSAIVEGFEQTRQQAVEDVAAAASEAGVPCETAVVHGTPAASIVKFAEKHDIDCIVMGSHGRRGLSRLLLGSTTDRVLRETTVPVLVVRSD